MEALSKYVDARVNFYVPENKKKKITHNYKKRAELQGTRLYAVSGGHEYEYALKGYDIEIGGQFLGSLTILMKNLVPRYLSLNMILEIKTLNQ